MKYIISESRFEDLISNYLSDSLKNIEYHSDVIDGDEYEWWGIKDTPIFALLENSQGKIGIAFDEQYVFSISNLFGVSEEEVISHMLKWINSKLDIYPDHIHILEQDLF